MQVLGAEEVILDGNVCEGRRGGSEKEPTAAAAEAEEAAALEKYAPVASHALAVAAAISQHHELAATTLCTYFVHYVFFCRQQLFEHPVNLHIIP